MDLSLHYSKIPGLAVLPPSLLLTLSRSPIRQSISIFLTLDEVNRLLFLSYKVQQNFPSSAIPCPHVSTTTMRGTVKTLLEFQKEADIFITPRLKGISMSKRQKILICIRLQICFWNTSHKSVPKSKDKIYKRTSCSYCIHPIIYF